MRQLAEESFKMCKQVNKMRLRLLSVRLYLVFFFSIILTICRPLITYNCELYPLPNVKICSIIRNVFVSPAKLGFALYISLHKLNSIDNF